MKREPDFNDKELDDAIMHRFREMLGQEALRVIHWILVGITGCFVSVAGAAIWATKTYIKLDQVVESQTRMELATEKRIIEWGAWRESVDAKLRGMDARTSDRWTRSSMRDYSAQMSNLNPSMKVPDPDVIASRQAP